MRRSIINKENEKKNMLKIDCVKVKKKPLRKVIDDITI